MSPAATTTNPARAIRRGEYVLYRRATTVLAMKIESVYGMIENDVCKLLRPWMICMYSGMRKLAAVPTNIIVAMQIVVARSAPVLRTSRLKS